MHSTNSLLPKVSLSNSLSDILLHKKGIWPNFAIIYTFKHIFVVGMPRSSATAFPW
jgi:hypothetical protein